MITRLDTQYRELIDKYETLLDIVNQSRTSDGQASNTPSALSLQEELGMLEFGDMINNVNSSDVVNDSLEDEAGLESDIALCGKIGESLHLENCSESSGFFEGEELPEVEKVCQDCQTDISSIGRITNTMAQTNHQTIFSQLFALIRQEI